MVLVTARDGVRLAVRDYGPTAAAHTLVLLHGFCLSKESWDIQVESLTRRWGDDIRVLSYDHRGHGHSAEAPMDTYRIEQLAEDLADVLSLMNVSGNVTLAGHSMGGMVALAYMGLSADQRPVDPVSLVLVATAAGNLTERGVGRLLTCPGVNSLYKLTNHLPTRMLDRLIRRASAPLCKLVLHYVRMVGDTAAANTALTAGTINATPLRTKVGFLPSLKNFNCYSVLPTITARTTILSGELDFFTPREHADDMHAAIPDVRHLHHPTAGHMLLGDTPGLVTSALSRAVSVTRKIPRNDRSSSMIEVTVYTKPSCPQCLFTETKLDDLGVPYKTVDVTEDSAALEYLRSLGYSSAPVVLVSGDVQHWSGFRPDRLAGLAERSAA